VSYETSFDSKQPKMEPKLVSTLSETRRLFRLFRFNIETACFGVSIEPKQWKRNRNKIEKDIKLVNNMNVQCCQVAEISIHIQNVPSRNDPSQNVPSHNVPSLKIPSPNSPEHITSHHKTSHHQMTLVTKRPITKCPRTVPVHDIVITGDQQKYK
jgi:hypothetical protein